MSFRAGFLIIAASLALHAPAWAAGLLLVGYYGFGQLDEWLLRRKRDRLYDEEISGWKNDSEDPEFESKGNLSRIKLARNEQIIVTRVVEFLRRMP
jgi:hypothetical protein